MELYKQKWRLEQRIWEAVATFYDGSSQVANLQARLKDYHRLSEEDKDAMKIGLERLSEKLIRSTVEQVVRAKYEGRIEAGEGKKEERKKRERGYRGLVSQGIDTIFDGEDPSLLKPEVRERRNWLVAYAGILDLIEPGNKLAANVLSFVRNVNTLLLVYNNLECERVYFLTRKMRYAIEEQHKPKVKAVKSSYGIKGVVANLESNRKRLKEIKSKDKVVNDSVGSLLQKSYELSEIIFMTLYVRATTLQSDNTKKIGIDLHEWEKARLEIRRQLKSDLYFKQLGHSVWEFYHGRKTIMDMLKEKASGRQ